MIAIHYCAYLMPISRISVLFVALFGLVDFCLPQGQSAQENVIHVEIQESEKEARSNVEHWGKQLRAAGFPVDATVEIGEVRSTIIDSAAHWGADLIVVGSHGHKGLERLLLGSVAESVVRHAKTSVLVVRNPVLKTKSS